jgi:hypothetical protein
MKKPATMGGLIKLSLALCWPRWRPQWLVGKQVLNLLKFGC